MARVPAAAPINMEVMNRFLDSAIADEQIATLKRGISRISPVLSPSSGSK
jgi:hypothetical protein